jgi:pimeloyl-ACP methyl ester carboxylesterase
MHAGAPVKQHIQYATSSDGVRIAYAAMGQGTPVVRASHWLTHLEYELDSPVWRHLILGMASRHKFIRYDGRGTGLSQRDAVDISMDRWVSDLECIVDSLLLERFVLLGVSRGGAISIQYAARHPQDDCDPRRTRRRHDFVSAAFSFTSSVTRKPKRNVSRTSDPKYRLWRLH